MIVLISCFFLLISSIHGQSLNQTIVFHIGAFFNSDFYDLQAAQLAIEEINLRSNELFHQRYRLTLLSNHSRVNNRTKKNCSSCFFLSLRHSVIQFMPWMHSFMQSFVDLNYSFFLERRVPMKQKRLFKLLIIII